MRNRYQANNSARFFLLSLLFICQSLISTYVFASDHSSVNKQGVALAGYDPVSFFSHRPVKGKESIFLDDSGTRYYFSTEENKVSFLNNPSAFKPQYGGYCAYGVRMGKKLAVNETNNGIEYEIVERKLYLLLNRATHEIWRSDSSSNIRYADKLWPSLTSEP